MFSIFFGSAGGYLIGTGQTFQGALLIGAAMLCAIGVDRQRDKSFRAEKKLAVQPAVEAAVDELDAKWIEKTSK